MPRTEKTRSPRKIANEQKQKEREQANRELLAFYEIVSDKRPSKAMRLHWREVVRRNTKAVS